MIKNQLRLSVAIAAAATSTVLAAPPTIQDLAPETTILLAGADNAEQAYARLKETGLWDLWQSEQMKDLRAEAMEELETGLTEMLEDLGLDRDSLQPPTGALGATVFTVTSEDGVTGIGFLLSADYGENADRTSEVIAAAVKKAEEEGDLTYEEREIMGRTVLCFDVPTDEQEAIEFEGDEEFAPPGIGDMFDPQAMMGSMETVYLVREGTTFVLCTDQRSLERAFEVFDGGAPEGIAQREDFQGVMAQIGEQDIYGVLLTRDLGNLLAASDSMGMMMMVVPMLKQFVGDFRGFGAGYRLDGATAMIEGAASAYMPMGKAGLTALLDTETPRAQLPPFVAANTASYSAMNFEFDGVPALVQQVMQVMGPMMGGMDAGPDQPSPQEMVGQFTACLGRQVHIVQTLDRPIKLDSVQQLVAIECTNPQEFETLLANLAPQMGLEGRDFLGHRIFTADPAMFAGMAPMGAGMAAEPVGIGIAGEYVFLGQATSVEQAVRTIGQPDLMNLAGEAAFQRAMSVLDNAPVVGWGYGNIVDSIEGQLRVGQLQYEQMMEEFAAEDPEWAAELEEEMGLSGFEQILDKLDFDELRQYLGPSSWTLRATDDGFVARSYLLAPTAP